MDAEWHEQRRAGLGGSDIAAILGLSPWQSALDVWSAKVEGAVNDTETLQMWLGTRLEPVLFELYESRTGHKVRRVPGFRRSEAFPWAFANLDGKVEGEPVAVEAKVPGSYDGRGEDGSADIPVHYRPQVQHYLAVTGYEWCDVVALIGNRALRIYPVLRDDDYILDLMDF